MHDTGDSGQIRATREYRAVALHYAGRATRRSSELLIKHIDDGLRILAAIGASTRAMRAYCLHPLVQADEDLATHYGRLADYTDDVQVAALALEYRSIANATLSTRPIRSPDEITLSPLRDVFDMLIADKVQNRADFVRHHLGTHPRSDELARYFTMWLERLGVTEARYLELLATSGISPREREP